MKPWTLEDLRAANHKRQEEWCDGTNTLPDLSFRGNELAGEVGEACNEMKKLERERLGWRGSRTTLDKLADELADVVICADLCTMSAGVDLYAAVVKKFNETTRKVGLTTFMQSDVCEDEGCPHSNVDHRHGTAPQNGGCIWPDCGHDTNCTGYMPGCTGKFCPRINTAEATAAQLTVKLYVTQDKSRWPMGSQDGPMTFAQLQHMSNWRDEELKSISRLSVNGCGVYHGIYVERTR